MALALMCLAPQLSGGYLSSGRMRGTAPVTSGRQLAVAVRLARTPGRGDGANRFAAPELVPHIRRDAGRVCGSLDEHVAIME